MIDQNEYDDVYISKHLKKCGLPFFNSNNLLSSKHLKMFLSITTSNMLSVCLIHTFAKWNDISRINDYRDKCRQIGRV